MFIHVAVETPQNLSAKQRELLEAFEAEATKGSPDHEGFFAKVAAFFEGGRGQSIAALVGREDNPGNSVLSCGVPVTPHSLPYRLHKQT
jgi:hypothetical protein